MHTIDFTKSIARDAIVATVSAGIMEAVLGASGGGVTLSGAEGTDRLRLTAAFPKASR